MKAQKLSTGRNNDEDELEEESLLETPLDKIEPYGLFKGALISKLVLILDKSGLSLRLISP